jgi:hypothetical protein
MDSSAKINIVGVSVPCKRVTENGTPGEKNFFLKRLNSDHSNIMNTLFVKQFYQVILLIFAL